MMERSVDKRIERDKAKLLEILEKNPVVQLACERAGVGKTTFYRWKNEDAAFARKADAALTSGNEFVSDIAISQLISAIKDKNMHAIRFWLTNHHRDYTTKMHIIAEVHRDEPLSPEQEAAVRRALELASQETYGPRTGNEAGHQPDGQRSEST